MKSHATRKITIRTYYNPGTVDMVAPAPASAHMALFGMVWLLRLRSELRQSSHCHKCSRARHELHHRNLPGSSNAPIFTVDTSSHPGDGPDLAFCQVHGYVSHHPSKEGKCQLTMKTYYHFIISCRIERTF